MFNSKSNIDYEKCNESPKAYSQPFKQKKNALQKQQRVILSSYQVHIMVLSWSFHGILKLVQACLRAPPVVAEEAKLDIVFTYFFLLLSFYAFCFSPS